MDVAAVASRPSSGLPRNPPVRQLPTATTTIPAARRGGRTRASCVDTAGKGCPRAEPSGGLAHDTIANNRVVPSKSECKVQESALAAG